MPSSIGDALTVAGALYNHGQFDAAKVELSKVLENDPDNLVANVLSGAIGVKTRQFAEAEGYLYNALRIEPKQFDALIFLSTMRKAQERFTEGVEYAQSAVAAEPNNPVALNSLGICLLSAHRAKEAADALAKAVNLNPRSAQAHYHLGLALSADNRPADAAIALRTAIRLAPDSPANYVELYRQLEWLGRWEEAAEMLKQGLARRPDSVPLILSLAKTHTKLGQAEEAQRRFKQALKFDPSAAQHYGLWLQESGRFEESIAYLLQSIDLNPQQGMGYYYLAEAKGFDLPTRSLTERIESVDRETLAPLERMYLAYALGKCHDRSGRFEAAMNQFDIANELAYNLFCAVRRYDAEEWRGRSRRIEAFFSAETLGRLRSLGSQSDQPIFIVGMIRSGTTLVDQILSSHPAVASAGEQLYWNLTGRDLEASLNLKDGAPDASAGREWERIGKLLRKHADEYLADLGKSAGAAERITDKMPLNYAHLGQIHAALPNAKIVHVRRSPADTCLSIYMTHFGRGPEWAYHRENIVANYRDYLELMAHWRAVLPGDRFYDIDYEALVADRESVTRGVLAFCDLPWDDTCLHHEENTSVVMTPSRWQARQPIYRSSVERWRNYEPWIAPFDELPLV